MSPFLAPRSVAVIGASERPGSWGSFIMNGLLTWDYPGRLYPVNHRAEAVFGRPCFPDVAAIPDTVDLAVLAIPERSVEQTVAACARKGVKGITIITAGFGEAVADGHIRERELARMARSRGMRLLGPNVSGTFNLQARFNASAAPAEQLLPTPLAAVCQGGYAFYDLLASGYGRGMGVGWFVHTGNECDLQITDFLDYFGNMPEVKGVLLYVETLRDGARFLDVARRVSRSKPVVVHKAGRTRGGSRAARSHTGAMAGRREIYEGGLQQAGVTLCPSMELLLPLGQALMERPRMPGRRVGIVTMGGSWGVALTDQLEEEGLEVPEFGEELQGQLRALGMPSRASTRNPVDIGAAGFYHMSMESVQDMGRRILASGEVDALVFHGLGRPGMVPEDAPAARRLLLELEKGVMSAYHGLEKAFQRPVLIGSCASRYESQAVGDITAQGIRIYHRMDEIAQILARLSRRWEDLHGR